MYLWRKKNLSLVDRLKFVECSQHTKIYKNLLCVEGQRSSSFISDTTALRIGQWLVFGGVMCVYAVLCCVLCFCREDVVWMDLSRTDARFVYSLLVVFWLFFALQLVSVQKGSLFHLRTVSLNTI